jgi:very-short-patch-repair endonuclease
MGKATFKDLTGKKFGKLTVVALEGQNKWGQMRYECICDCGNRKVIRGVSLTAKNGTRSCGCIPKSKSSKPANMLLDKLSEQLGLNVIREYPLGFFFFDGYIKELNVLIESDGTYWHSSKKAKENDARKTALAEELGFIFIRVKNDSIKDVEAALTYVMSAIQKSTLQQLNAL